MKFKDIEMFTVHRLLSTHAEMSFGALNPRL